MQHYNTQIPYLWAFHALKTLVLVLKEIVFRKREYQEYITPQDFGSEVFFCVKYDKIHQFTTL